MRLLVQVAFFLAPIATFLPYNFAVAQAVKAETLQVCCPSDFETKILDKLRTKRITVDFFEQRMGDMQAEYSSDHGFPVFFHESAADNNLDAESVVTLRMTDVTLQEVLLAILRPYECTLHIQNDALHIVSNDFASENLEIRIYDCKKLIANKLGGDARRLLEQIQKEAAPESWPDNGGSGTIAEFHGSLIVGASYKTHAKIENLLSKFASVSTSEPIQLGVPKPRMDMGMSATYEKLTELQSFDYFETRLDKVSSDLEKRHSFGFGIHDSATDSANLNDDTIITIRADNISGLSLLMLLAERHNCTLTIIDDTVQFVGVDQSLDSEMLVEWKFDISKLAQLSKATKLGEAISTSIAPDSWEANGGNASLLEDGDKLIIKQTLTNLVKIHGVLHQLHQPEDGG